jgi:hypothetical protein
MSFVFSAGGHFVEPSDLFGEGLPASLRQVRSAVGDT